MADNDLIELTLEEGEALILETCNKDVSETSKLAAQKAFDLADLLTQMVNARNKGIDAQNEYFRQLTRFAKARARQFVDIVDVDPKNKKIVFKKNKRDLAKLTVVPDETDDEAPSEE